MSSFAYDDFFTSKGYFQFDKFAKLLSNEYNIKNINGRLSAYENGIYVSGASDIERLMLDIYPLSRAQRKEVLEYLKCVITGDNRPQTDCIAFENGIYSIDEDKLISPSPAILMTAKIPWNYKRRTSCKPVDEAMRTISGGDKEVEKLLWEIIGYTFFQRSEMRKAFVLVGDKGNGKSTYIDMITHALGFKNISSLDLKSLGYKYMTAQLYGKLANLGDDIEDDYLPDPATFKKLVSGDRVEAEKKYEDPFGFNNFAKLIFSANDIPMVRDKTGAVLDRLVIVPFDVNMKSLGNFDPLIKHKLHTQEAAEHIISKGLKHLIELLERRSFTYPDKVRERMNQHIIDNNPFELYVEQYDREFFIDQTTELIYTDYKAYCIESSYPFENKVHFVKMMNRKFGFISKAKRNHLGKLIKYFSEKEVF